MIPIRSLFFLTISPVSAHSPSTPSEQTKGSSKAGTYGDWIHELDLSVGQLLEALDRMKIADNTLVILTSDNGGEDRNFASHRQRPQVERPSASWKTKHLRRRHACPIHRPLAGKNTLPIR